MTNSTAQAELEEFIETLRNLLDASSETSDIVQFLVDAILGNTPAGEINELLPNAFYGSMRREVYQELSQEMEEKLSERESQLKSALEKKYQEDIAKYEEELELGVIYEIMKKRFLTEKGFSEYAFERIKEDIVRSKERGEFPDLYDLVLENAGTEKIVSFLVSRFKSDLIERFGQEIKDELLRVDYETFLVELKDSLKGDHSFMEQARQELLNDIAKKIFD